MLDIMRRKKRLKVVLWLVIIGLSIGMLVFFVPGQNLGGGISGTIATVEDESIPHGEYQKIWRRVLDQYSAGGKNQMDPKLMKTLGLDRQALDLLITNRVIDYAAKKLGLDVSPEEVRRAVETNPNLQNRGAFVGVEQYKAILQANNVDVAEFEDQLRSSLLARKVRNVVADSMDISDRDLRQEFERTRQEAQARFVLIARDDFKKRVAPKEPDLRAYFDANKTKFAQKEERRAQYLLLTLEKGLPIVKVSEEELKARWEKESKEESVDANHILVELKPEDAKDPAKEAAARAKAEGLLKRVRAGENFEDLARANSDDKGSAAQGGNLGQFQRGRMVKEFDDAAFKLKPGEVSDVVKTQFGFHIIKVLRHETPTFEGMRKSLERAIAFDKASALVKQKSAEAEKLSATQKDLAAIAKAVDYPCDILELPFLSREVDPISHRISQPLLEEIFRLKEVGSLGRLMDHPQGYAIPKLLETKLPRPTEFAEVKDKVEKDYVEMKAVELLQAEAKKLTAEATSGGDLGKAAQKLGLSVKDSISFKRADVPAPELGSAPAFNAAAFDLPVGGVSQPISLDANRLVVLQVKSRTPFDEAEFQKQKADLRNQLLGTWQDAYFQEYIRRVTESLEKAGKIRINQKAMDAITGLQSS
jgi:peptidyl-prolyl cis-trans isomerase D